MSQACDLAPGHLADIYPAGGWGGFRFFPGPLPLAGNSRPNGSLHVSQCQRLVVVVVW